MMPSDSSIDPDKPQYASVVNDMKAERNKGEKKKDRTREMKRLRENRGDTGDTNTKVITEPKE